ncbi:MAG: polyhydroxyalkanoate synthesis regulator DNA-binding domain-containing protein [Candidatus Promineifilaceae bacterium]|nr:polyhydroxyalkanoate synthesis regulator DNA-binding domain-containing protein [Candidatus Promineifilaceae bacterium]
MRVIKRYPNRKLYDTEAKEYVTLSGIAELIRDGHEIQVVDHTTGEDLTAVTLTQIIFEQEKKQSGFLPRSVLTGLIQAGGEKLSTLRHTLASPLDLFHQVDEEIDRRVRALIRRGELEEDEGLKLRDQLLAEGDASLSALSEAELERVLVKRGVPTKEEWEQLEERLETLVQKLNTLLEDERSDQTA